MAKKKRKKKVTSQESPRPFWQGLTKTHQRIGAVVIIVLVLAVYFEPLVFEGLSPTGSDVIGSIGSLNQLNKNYKETGERPLWNPYVFAGMPIYFRSLSNEIALDRIIEWLFFKPFNQLYYPYKGGVQGAVYFIIGAIGMFFLTHFIWGFPIRVSLLASIAFVLMPHYRVLLQAGHYQKLRSIMMMPWILLCFQYYLHQSKTK